MDVFHRSVDHWRRTGAPVRPPASQSEIEDTFANLNFPLTDDVRRWYSLADGFEDVDETSCFWWWPLERIREENQHPHRDSNRLWFADFLISSHHYCLCDNEDEGASSSIWIDYDPYNHWGVPSFMDRVSEHLLKLFGNTQGVQRTEGHERYQHLAETITDFLEKYLHNPEDVDVLILGSMSQSPENLP